MKIKTKNMELLDTLESFLNSGVTNILQNKPRNLLAEAKKKKQTAPKHPILNVPKAESITKNLNISVKNTALEIKAADKLAEQADSLEKLKNFIENFEGCTLKKAAQNTVFSDGETSSKIMLIGEAPGATEDEQGIPFCGISGTLLNDIFRSIGYKREKNLYITNSVFWRPPANRKPTDEEIAICRPFVEKHIALQKPELIILVGSTALSSLMPDNQKTISKIRGEIFPYTNKYLQQEIKMMPIFHPSYLLRQGSKKKLMWEDCLEIQRILTK